MGAGHASTAIGYAVGIKEAMRRGHGEDGHVVAVVGDGAMTGGVAFEAVHQAGGEGTPIVVVLNDNGMSIAPNVGALSRYFNRIRLNPKLWHAREEFEEGLTKLPGRHRRRVRAPRAARQGVDQGVLGAGAVVGGARLRLHGRDRRPRRARAAPRAARGAVAPSGRSWSTAPRSRARASPRPRRAAWRGWRSGTPPSPSRSPTAPPPVADPSTPSARQARAAAVHPGVRQRAGRGVPARRPGDRDHRRDELGHRPQHPPARAARPLLRRRHRRAAGGAVRRRAGARRGASRSPRSTRRSCSAPTTRSSTTSACRS